MKLKKIIETIKNERLLVSYLKQEYDQRMVSRLSSHMDVKTFLIGLIGDVQRRGFDINNSNIDEFKDLIITTLFDDVEPEFETDEAGKFWHTFKLPDNFKLK